MMRDIDLTSQFADKVSIDVSITTDSDEIARKFEPEAPFTTRRLKLVRALSDAASLPHTHAPGGCAIGSCQRTATQPELPISA
ncbi:MAG: hypothetical protein IT342_11035 [Candidatus Melainabacteria bacterium]|nr:hypothetical protein [Candidatus Melainabacteria bacterium]